MKLEQLLHWATRLVARIQSIGHESLFSEHYRGIRGGVIHSRKICGDVGPELHREFPPRVDGPYVGPFPDTADAPLR